MNYLLEGEESERLLYRKLVESDFDAWLAFHEDPSSMQYWPAPYEEPDVACRTWFDKVFYRYENNLGGHNALIEKESAKLVGMCGLLIQTVDDIEELEIGYSLLPEFRKMGFASEAAIRCREYAAKNDLRDSIISIIHEDNVPSKKVALKNGMHLDKTTTFKGIPVEIYRVLLK